MRMDNNKGNNNYQNNPIPPTPNITFLSHPPKPHLHFRESAALEGSNVPKHIESHPRYSQEVSSQSNNAFAHLRNQISNLRLEFTRLIQKDPKQQPEKQVRGSFGLRWEQRPPTYSTMGFYNTGEGSNNSIKDIQGINFKNKALVIQKSELQIQIQKKKVKQQAYLRGTKRYSSQLIDKQQLAPGHSEMVGQANKIQELQIQIRKLDELKRRAQEQNTLMKKEMTTKQIQYFQKNQCLSNQLEKTRVKVDQLNISLSLKNSLFQKLEREGSVSHEQTTKIKQKYQAQIATLQSIHRRSLDEIIEKYRFTQQKLQQTNETQQQKDESYKRMEIYLKDLKNENQELQLKLDKLSSINSLLQGQTKKLEMKLNEQQLGTQRNSKMLDQDTQLKLKKLQDQNVDLRKRVQSYKKTVEQLNTNNNSARQKQLVLKQQCKILKEQMRKLSQGSQSLGEQVRIKQNLITSLYRDIGILDNQIRHSGHLKTMICGMGKYIDQLNHKIVTLQSQKLNSKYGDSKTAFN